MKVLGRIFLNSRKERQKDRKTERPKGGKTEIRKDRVFLWDVEELTFLKIISSLILYVEYYRQNNKIFNTHNAFSKWEKVKGKEDRITKHFKP